MKLFKIIVATFVLLMVAFGADAGLRDRASSIELYGESRNPGNYIHSGAEITAPSGNPATNSWWLYFTSSGLILEDDAGSTTTLGSASNTAWTDIADATGDSTIAHGDNEITTLTFADTNEDMMTINGIGNFGDVSVVRINQITGNPTNGTALEVVAADANVDPLVVSASGKANALVVGQNTGVVTIAGVATGTDTLVLTAGDILLTDGNLDLTTGNLTLSGGSITLDNGLTLDNAVNNVYEWNENSEGVLWTFASNVLDLSSDTGINQLDFLDNAAATLTHGSNGAGDDLTISQTGAQNSSLHLSSAGTGADALTVTASAGGIDITISGGAAGEDIDISTDTSINLSATENAASSMTLTTNGGASETMVLTNTQGTGDAAIDINGTAGGLDVDVAKQLALTSSENTADSVVITSSAGGVDILASGAAAGEDIDITATGSSINIISTENQANAIVLDASDAAGGMDIDAGTGGIDIDITGAADFAVDSSAGSVVLIGAEAAADAITIDAENAAGGIDMDYGTGGMVLTGTGTAANLTIDADAVSFDMTDSSNISVTSSEAAEDLTISQIGGNDSSIIVTSAGTGANAIELTTSNAAGDIDINAGDAITVDAGDVVITTDDALADQFKVAAGGAVAGNAINLETTNGGILVHANHADNGDIQLDSADDMTFTAAGNLTLSVTGTLSAGTAAVTDVLRDAETVASANVIAATECGKTFYLSAGTEFESTLPALSGVSAGCEMKFVIAAAAAGANYTIITGDSKENQINGLISVNSTHVACATEDTITFVDGDAIGDWVSLESDGTSWFITGEAITAAKLTCTQAD